MHGLSASGREAANESPEGWFAVLSSTGCREFPWPPSNLRRFQASSIRLQLRHQSRQTHDSTVQQRYRSLLPPHKHGKRSR